MSELILGGIILALLGGFGWYVREQEKVKSKLINSILSKDAQEYVNRTLADTTQIIRPEVNPPSDLIPMDQLNEEQFDAHIRETLGNELTDEEIDG